MAVNASRLAATIVPATAAETSGFSFGDRHGSGVCLQDSAMAVRHLTMLAQPCRVHITDRLSCLTNSLHYL